MLPRTRRLSDDKTIEKTKLSGKVYSDDVAIFIVDSQENSEDTKFCVVVSTQVSKKAVKRNSVKRKVNLFLENNLADFKKGFNIVIIAKRKVLEKEQSIIDEKFYKLSKKAKIVI